MKLKLFIFLAAIAFCFILSFSVLIHFKLLKLNQKDIFSKLNTARTISIFQSFENEGDIYSYSAFTFDNFYPSESGIYKRNAIKLTGIRKNDLHSIINASILHLNLNSAKNHAWTDFVIGFTRSDPINGFEYKLFFKYNNSSCCQVVQIQRPLASLIFKEKLKDRKKFINFLVPLNTDDSSFAKLKRFLRVFIEIALKKDQVENVLILIIGFSDEVQIKRFDDLVSHFFDHFNLNCVKMLKIKMNVFSRAELLNFGAKSLGADELMFFCDIDVVFNELFLEACRSNVIEGEQVFYPILFSYYNPVMLEKVYNLKSAQQDFKIDKFSGYFRTTGFGMVCVYNKDFHQIGGFDDWKSKDWGGEDLFLYRKFIKSNLKIFRAITPGLFHVYHTKKCDKKSLDQKQFKNCIKAKIFNEASHETFGMLYFNYRNFLE